MAVYQYRGPVYRFGKMVCEYWEAVTTAVSIKKALNNLKFRYRQQNGYSNSTVVELPGIIQEI